MLFPSFFSEQSVVNEVMFLPGIPKGELSSTDQIWTQFIGQYWPSWPRGWSICFRYPFLTWSFLRWIICATQVCVLTWLHVTTICVGSLDRCVSSISLINVVCRTFWTCQWVMYWCGLFSFIGSQMRATSNFLWPFQPGHLYTWCLNGCFLR